MPTAINAITIRVMMYFIFLDSQVATNIVGDFRHSSNGFYADRCGPQGPQRERDGLIATIEATIDAVFHDGGELGLRLLGTLDATRDLRQTEGQHLRQVRIALERYRVEQLPHAVGTVSAIDAQRIA